MIAHHLAQFNVGRFIRPDDDPANRDFFDGLDRINALAESSPGFVWRYQDESGAATDTRPFEDPLVLVNFSVWESVESLRAFTYRSDHMDFFRRRYEWFTPEDSALTMWWIPAGSIPTIDEAMERLAHMREHGPTEQAFTFGKRFDPPGS